MSTRRPGKDWPQAFWDSASALSLPAIAALAVLAGALVLARGNAVPAVVTVAVGQQNGGAAKADQYNPASLGIAAGDTVRWEWFGGVHDVTSYSESAPGTPEWQSGLIKAAGEFYERQFASPGVSTYYCSIHALPAEAAPAVIDQNIAAGKMVGKVVVAAPATPTPSPSPSPSPTPSPTTAPTASPTPTPAGPSATASPAPSATPAVTPSPVPSPTVLPTPTPVPPGSPSPTPEPSATPSPTALPSPTDGPPTSTPSPSPTPPATPSPAPPTPEPSATPAPTTPPAATATPSPTHTATPTPSPRPATATPSPAPTNAPIAAQATPTPAAAANAQPATLGAAGAPAGFPQTGASSSVYGGSISPLFRILTLSLTGLLIAIVIGGFIWIERSRSDQPR